MQSMPQTSTRAGAGTCTILGRLLGALSVLGIAGLVAAPAAAADGRRPNIVIILGDDMGYADMGKVGSEIKTPNLDSLAKEGVQSRPVGKSG
jgi:arylsulfatase